MNECVVSFNFHYLFFGSLYCWNHWDKGIHDDSGENISPASKINGDKSELEIEEGLKFPTNGSPYTCQKKVVDMEESDGAKKHQMPPASVMTRLVLIMVWRKLIRNPNTYSSLIGLTWSLVSYRYPNLTKILFSKHSFN